MTPLSAAEAEGHEGRKEQIRQVIEESLRQLESGGSFSQDELIAAYPHLMPELAEELAKVALIADAASAALLEAWNDAVQRMDEDTIEPLDSSISTGTIPVGTSPQRTCHGASRPLPRQIGRYPILDRLGGGGQAEVYLAMHPLLRRQVVIKLSRRMLAADQVDQDRFIAEGKRLAELEHPQLARVYDLDLHEQRPFLVMQYVCGPNLRQYAQARPVAPREAAGLVARLAHALAVAHARGIAHQDIKPENVVVDPKGEPVLIDFGLCVLHDAWSDALGHDDAICGTPEYMAPEQARGDKSRSRQRSDVFALGAILYFLLTGEPPFVGESRLDALDRAARGEFDRDALQASEIPRPLAKICLRAMQVDPADRYLTATELAKELERYLSGPQRWAMVGAGALLVALVGVAVWRGTASGPSPHTPPAAIALLSERPDLPGGKLQVQVVRHNQAQSLAQALPLHTSDILQVIGELPEGLNAQLFWLDSQAMLHQLPLEQVPPAESKPAETPVRLIWPEPGKASHLADPPGTEVLVFCASRAGQARLEEVRQLLAHESPWPAMPSDRMLTLNGTKVEVVAPHGPAGHKPPVDPQLEARATRLSHALSKKCDLLWGAVFPHVEP